MRKYYLFLIIPFLVILLILFVLYNRYSGYYEEEQLDGYISKNINILDENLEFEKRYALYLSLFLSKNQTIKNALKTNDQQRALKELDRFLSEIKSTAKTDNVDIQVHTKDLKAFARSWDKSNYLGVDLSGFRKGLVKVKQTLIPSVSIELGKRLNIKAISPILDEKHDFTGSVEAIVGFQNLKKRLHKLDLDVIGLLDEKFIRIAVDLKDNKRIGRYYVLEKTYPQDLFRILSQHQHILQDNKHYHKIDDRIVVMVPMKSVGIQDVGVIALSIPANRSRTGSYKRKDIVRENDQYRFNKNRRDVTIK